MRGPDRRPRRRKPLRLTCKRGHLRNAANLTENKSCRVCLNEYRYGKTLTPEQLTRQRAASRAWAIKNRDKLLAVSRKRKGLPPPTRPETSVCECCGGPPGTKRMRLDHCHDTNEFRGWLCGKCNTGIGQLGDNINGVRNALAYLERFHGRNT